MKTAVPELSLTPRQTELLSLVCLGHSTSSACRHLGISAATGEVHLRLAMLRNSAPNRVVLALRFDRARRTATGKPLTENVQLRQAKKRRKIEA
jgi:DNA-binding CsgD family transcriptional regulator